MKSCPFNCSLNGYCNEFNKCECYKNYHGEYCQHKDCLNNCSGFGLCNNGKCICPDDKTGSDCSI